MPTESALIQRIRRKLAKDGESLHLNIRGMGVCISNADRVIIASGCDLDKLAEELGVN